MDVQYFDHFFPAPHIFGVSEEFKAPRGRNRQVPERDRYIHANRLLDEHEQVLEAAQRYRQSRLEQSLPVMDGVQIEFLGGVASPLVIRGLEEHRKGIYLLNVRQIQPDGLPPIQSATVYLPSAPRGVPNAYFADKIRQYRDENTQDKGVPRHDLLIRSIESVRLANLTSFWFSMDTAPPDEKTEVWCEIWLTRPEIPKKRKRRIRTNSVGIDNDGTVPDTATRFSDCCRLLEIECRKDVLQFPEQEVFLVLANGVQLQGLVDSVEMLSSICPYREPTSFFLDMPAREQPEWIEDTLSRLAVHTTPTSSVCLLDKGVNNGHPLLAPVIPDEHCHSVNIDGDVADFHNPHEAHGTEMCGIVAFGNLSDALESSHPLTVDHAVESVKILFEGKENPEKLFGQIVTRAVSLAETEKPDFNRVSCLATTAEGIIDGTPSSWSASIDQLAFGEELGNDPELDTTVSEPSEHKRLFVVSAGNVRHSDDWENYPESNATMPIEDPAQSWNALTVGAFTSKAKIVESNTEGYTVVAPLGGLSPFSRTSELWDHRWPLKPDIVLEGGNVARTPQGDVADYESLAVLTTAPDWESRGNHFSPFRGTSPATAQASWMAAKIFTACPKAWPETVRGLLVHSARWTDAMMSNKPLHKIGKTEIRQILRTVGYGVPNLTRSIQSTRNAFTIIIQDDQLQPLSKSGSVLKYNAIRLFEFPWPKDILRELGDTQAEMRVTLSYFIAPSPGHKSWNNRYRYPSHTLRFDVNNVGEDRATFYQRLNAKEKGDGDNEEIDERDSGSERWMIGKTLRNRGSIHTDIWSGLAVNMVDCRYIAVYPSAGWWKERPQFGRGECTIRFSLIVSLEVPESAMLGGVPVDLYTPVQQEIVAKTQVSSILTTVPIDVR